MWCVYIWLLPDMYPLKHVMCEVQYVSVVYQRVFVPYLDMALLAFSASKHTMYCCVPPYMRTAAPFWSTQEQLALPYKQL